MEGMVRKNKEYFSVSPRNGKIGWLMVTMTALVIGIFMSSNSSAAATPFLPAEDKGISTGQNSVLTAVDSENLTAAKSGVNPDSIKNQIQTVKNGKSIPDTLKVIQGEGCDYDPPYWSGQKPFRGQPNVIITQKTFEFILRDDRTGVEMETFHLTVDGIDIDAKSPGLTVVGNPQKYSIRYNLPANRSFFWGDTIWIKLEVCDRNEPPNCMADSMFFVMEADTIAPIILPAGPFPGDMNVAVNTAIKLSILDTKAGVDFTTLKLYLNGINYSDSVKILQNQTPNVIINSERRTLFGFNQSVKVEAEVKDLKGNFADTTYSFVTMREPFPPKILFIHPTRNSTVLLAVRDSLVFQLKDEHSQIDTSLTKIVLKINNENTDFQILAIRSANNEKEFTYTIRPARSIQYNMTGQLRVQGFDESRNTAIDSTWLKFVQDKTGPAIILINPQANAAEVDLNHAIEFKVNDELAGVNRASIRVFVNGVDQTNLSAIQELLPSAKSFQVTLPRIAYWNNQFSVQIFASDLAYPENKSSLTFEYFIKKDNQGPLITPISPLPNQQNVTINQVVEFQVEDNLAGVNRDSIRVFINGVDQTNSLAIRELKPLAKSFQVTLPVTAYWNDTINVKITASDLANPGNDDSLTYRYFIKRDDQGPLIIPINPLPDQQNVTIDHVIEFEVEDDLAGVNSNSIKVTVNGIDRTTSLTISEVGSPSKKYRVSLSNTGFWNDTISVKIVAFDLSNPPKSNDSTYHFFIKRDDQGPLITPIMPRPEQQDVTIKHVIEFEVEDELAGVNSNSIKVTVNGSERTASLIKSEVGSPSKKYRVSLSNTGSWNDTISVRIVAADLSNPPIESASIYKYFIDTDIQGPVVKAESPAPGDQNVAPQNVKIQFRLKDGSAGIDLSSLKFYVKDKSIATSNLKPIDKNDRAENGIVQDIGYSYLAGNFSLGEKVRVRVNVLDDAGNPASGDTDYTFTITRDPYPPKIKIIQPLRDAKNVSRYLPVILEVTDLETGINTSSIILKINNEIVKPEIAPNFTNGFAPRQNFDSSYRVKYTPVPPYTWNSTNTVFIFVKDSVGHMDSLTYKFSAWEDLVGPEFINLKPLPDTQDVPSDSPVYIGVQDKLSGVNLESFVLKVNGAIIPRESITVIEKETKYNSIDLQNNQQVPEYYYLKYKPSQRFVGGALVQIELFAKDLAGNPSKNFKYSYNIYKDKTAPVIKLIQPPSLNNVARKTPVEFEVYDPESGVNMLLTQLWVNGNKISISPTQMSGDILIHVLTDSLGVFEYGAQIPFKIVAVNNDGLTVILEDLFQIIKDTTPPIIKLIQPQNRASVKTPVVFQLIDKETGINLAKSSFEIDRCTDGKIVVSTINSQTRDQFDLRIKPLPNGSGYEIRFNSEQIRRFAYFDKVKIRIRTENAPKLHEALAAVFDTTVTIGPGDITPPWVTNLKPDTNEVNVVPGGVIKFDVLDDSMGVDPASIKVQVSTQKGIVSYDSTHKAVYYQPKAKGFEVTLIPKTPFFYNDTVSVIIQARDKEPNTMAPFKYRFFIRLDKTGPVLQAIDPRDKQRNVTNSPVFKVLVTDDLAGVDKSSYRLSYRYSAESSFKLIDPQFYDLASDTIKIKPGTVTLEFDTVVVVLASIKDRIGNQGGPLEYSFRVAKEDTIPPLIRLVKPTDGKYDYHPDNLNEFIFEITDSYADINTGSIKVIISVFSDTTKAPDKSKEFQKESASWTGEKLKFSPASGKSIQVTCLAQQEPLTITKNQFVRMWIYAEDKFRNSVQDSFEVGTQQDQQAPILYYSSPSHEAMDVSPDSKVTLKLTDDPDGDGKDYSGVNMKTMRVWMRIIESNTAFDNDWSKAELVFPGFLKSKIDVNTDTIQVEPEISSKGDEQKFSVNQTIYFKIYAEDVVCPPNKLDTTIWFSTPNESADLSIASTAYNIIEKGGDSVRVECSAIIKNEFARVNRSEVELSFKLPDGKIKIITIPGPLEIGATVPVTLPIITLYKYGTKIITVVVDPYYNIPEKDESNNSADISIPGETRIYADPPIFSPNGDGINDETFIHCDGFDLQNPSLRIYDLYNRFICELTEYSQNPVCFKWDGRDQNGKIVMPGVYLYVLFDRNNNLGSGTVVVAY